MRDIWLAALCALGTVCFVACIGAAMHLYPGGTWFDRQAAGHSFSENFLCDLMQTEALNGQDATVSSTVARAGTVVLLLALIAFFIQVARLESPMSKAARLARSVGIVACTLSFAVPLVPSDLFRDAHVVVVVVAAVPGLFATLAALLVSLRSAAVPRWVRALALVTLLSGAVDFLLYVVAYAMAWGLIPRFQVQLLNLALPLFQRIATLGLLAWVLSVCALTVINARRAPAEAERT